MLKGIDEISLWKFKHIIDEKEWGKSNSTVSDFHNHDAAAGLMEGRATGAYAYECMMVSNKSNHIHALNKIKLMDCVISFLGEGRILNLIQTFILQPGTFEHDSSIQWFLTYNQVNRNLLNFKRKINEILDDQAFWPINAKNRKILNVDEKNKVLVVERSSKNNTYIIVMNMAPWLLYKYKVGVRGKNNFQLIFSGDKFEYAGFGINTEENRVFTNKESFNFELLDREIELENLPPYGILIFREIKNE